MSPTMRRSLRAAVIAATGIGLVVQGTAAADPLTDPLYKFYGTVSDPIGRGVAVATVSDGAKSVQSAVNGAYELGERDFNKTYRLVASKAGMESASKDVAVTAPLDTRVDFTLQYRTTASIARRYLSTANGATSTSLDVKTYAPNPGLPGQTGGASCVKVTDSGTGSQTDASYAATAPDGAASWVWTLNLAAATPERSGTLTVKTVDCATGTVLARDTSVTYVVDNTAPVIRNVFPIDDTMSSFGGSQQAGASFKDSGGAGIDTSTAGITVTDTVTGTTKAYAGSQVSYNATTGQATVGPMALTANHRHRVSVTVKDRAGNATTFGHRTSDDGGFTPVSVEVKPVTFTVPRVECDLGPVDLMTQRRSIACGNVKVNVGDSLVKLSQATHAGTGFTNVNIPLNGIQLVLEQATGNATQNPYTGTRFHAARFSTDSASATEVSLPTSGTVLDLGSYRKDDLNAPLATDAYIILTGASAQPTIQGCAGQSTVAGAVTCISDPLHSTINVVVKNGYDAMQVAQAHAAAYGIEVLGGGGTKYGANVPDAYIDDIRNDSRVFEVSRELPFGFYVPAREAAKHDITDTPEGQAAMTSNSGVLGIGTCVGTVRVLNMSAAAGLPNTGDPSYVFWPADRPFQDVSISPSGGAGFTTDFGPTSGETATAMSNSACNGGNWVRSGSNGCPAGKHNSVSYGSCATIYWLSNDNFADRDFYTIDSFASGKTTDFGKMIRFIGSETIGNQAKQVMRWEDYDPINDVTGPCKSVTVSISAAGVGLSGNAWSVCEKWDAEIWFNEPGHNQNVWRGDVARNELRGAEHMGTVSIPVSAGQRYISWDVKVHACASFSFPGCW